MIGVGASITFARQAPAEGASDEIVGIPSPSTCEALVNSVPQAVSTIFVSRAGGRLPSRDEPVADEGAVAESAESEEAVAEDAVTKEPTAVEGRMPSNQWSPSQRSGEYPSHRSPAEVLAKPQNDKVAAAPVDATSSSRPSDLKS